MIVTVYYDDGSSETWHDPLPTHVETHPADGGQIVVWIIDCARAPERSHVDVIPGRASIRFRYPLETPR